MEKRAENMLKDFENIAHTADVQLRVYGTTLKELFANALMGMFQSIGPQAPGCLRVNDRLVCDTLPAQHNIEVQASDQESLLVDFLSQALALSDIYNEAYLAADIHELDEHHIKATLKGVPITGFEVVEIKAVTYHGLKIEKKGDVWQVDVVFDI